MKVLIEASNGGLVTLEKPLDFGCLGCLGKGRKERFLYAEIGQEGEALIVRKDLGETRCEPLPAGSERRFNFRGREVTVKAVA